METSILAYLYQCAKRSSNTLFHISKVTKDCNSERSEVQKIFKDLVAVGLMKQADHLRSLYKLTAEGIEELKHHDPDHNDQKALNTTYDTRSKQIK